MKSVFRYYLLSVLIFFGIFPLCGQVKNVITLYPDQAKEVISKHIYGQFAEHLGTCIYGGLWVGEDSSIPNTQGYRNDVLVALRKLKIPNLRWPGGCFADEYHWIDGIGPKAERPKMVNNNWGGTIEDNSFGTHEFLNLCELLGCEPYISANVGSGTVEELAKWVEYMTSDGDTPMAKLRRQNGRERPWKVTFLGVGNESWGCGGNMSPNYYADLYKRYATYCRNYNGNRLFKIASGASDYDYNWTDVLMKDIGTRMNGISLHYYTVKSWSGSKGSATQFTNEDYYTTIGKSLEIESVIQKHIAIMDKYDQNKQVSLILDEWGTWWDEEPGTVRGHLYQQNSMRDAFVAALSLNIFHKYTNRLKMANIAQIVNVLQSMILTQNDKIVLTPTYYVFEMFKVHQDAINIPLNIECEICKSKENRSVPVISASASKDTKGLIHISLANTALNDSQQITVNMGNFRAKSVTGEILTSFKITDYNSFENPNRVKPQIFRDIQINKDNLIINLPAKSIVVLEVN